MSQTGSESLLFVRESSGLVRALGPTGALLFAWIGGGMTPTFWSLPPMVPLMTQIASLPLMFALILLIVIPEAISISLLQTSMPRSGGNYVVVARALGPFWGTLEGYRAFLSNPLSNALRCFFGAQAIGPVFILYGKLTGNPGSVSFGAQIAASFALTVAVAAFFIFLSFIIDVFGPKWVGRIYILFGIPLLVVLLLMWVTYASVPQTSIKAVWDSTWGAGAYDEVVKLATSSGYATPPMDWTKYAVGLIVPIGLVADYNTIPVAGEISRPTKWIPIACLSAAFVITAFYGLTALGVEHTYGRFADMYTFIQMHGLGSKLAISPNVPANWSFYAAIPATRLSPIISMIILLGPTLSVIATLPNAALYSSRSMFALAFDRFLPTLFTKISRWKSPFYACLVYLVLSLMWLVLFLGNPWVAAVSLLLTYVFVRLNLSLSGISLPWTKPSIHDRGLAWRIGGFPVMAIAGALASGFFAFAFMASFNPANLTPLYVFLLIYGIGTAGYMIAGYVNQRRGIDINRIFVELPPE